MEDEKKEQLNQPQEPMGVREKEAEEKNESTPTAEQEGTEKEEGSTEKNKDIEENKLWALLSYFGVLCLVPLLGKKDSEFAQFHGKQGLILLIGWIVSWFPVLGWIVGIIVLVLSVIGIFNVLAGEMKPLPIVGDLAKKINL